MFDQLDTTMIPGVCELMKKPVDVLPLLETIEKLLAKSFEERLAAGFRSGGRSESWIRASGSAPEVRSGSFR
jgi:hypothetical protein